MFAQTFGSAHSVWMESVMLMYTMPIFCSSPKVKVLACAIKQSRACRPFAHPVYGSLRYKLGRYAWFKGDAIEEYGLLLWEEVKISRKLTTVCSGERLKLETSAVHQISYQPLLIKACLQPNRHSSENEVSSNA